MALNDSFIPRRKNILISQSLRVTDHQGSSDGVVDDACLTHAIAVTQVHSGYPGWADKEIGFWARRYVQLCYVSFQSAKCLESTVLNLPSSWPIALPALPGSEHLCGIASHCILGWVNITDAACVIEKKARLPRVQHSGMCCTW
jgi:hypothetical protein